MLYFSEIQLIMKFYIKKIDLCGNQSFLHYNLTLFIVNSVRQFYKFILNTFQPQRPESIVKYFIYSSNEIAIFLTSVVMEILRNRCTSYAQNSTYRTSLEQDFVLLRVLIGILRTRWVAKLASLVSAISHLVRKIAPLKHLTEK